MEMIEGKVLETNSRSFERDIHQLIHDGYNDFNIKIISQERRPDGNVYYKVTPRTDKEHMIKKAKEMFPMLEIK